MRSTPYRLRITSLRPDWVPGRTDDAWPPDDTRMSSTTYPLKLPLSIKRAAARLAREDGVSLNQWIASAVAQKIGVVETTADFLRRRAGDATAADLLAALDAAPDRPPADEDRP